MLRGAGGSLLPYCLLYVLVGTRCLAAGGWEVIALANTAAIALDLLPVHLGEYRLAWAMFDLPIEALSLAMSWPLAASRPRAADLETQAGARRAVTSSGLTPGGRFPGTPLPFPEDAGTLPSDLPDGNARSWRERMLDPRLGAGLLVLLAAQQVHGNDVRAGAAPSVGERVRVKVARQYRADHIALDDAQVETSGEIVRRDRLTLTVVSREGRETRYPALRTRLEGRLTALDSGWLTLDLDDERLEVRVPRPAIERLEVSRGKRTRAREGAALGAVMPGVPLGLIGMFFASFSIDCESDCPPESARYVGATVGVAIGVGLGAAVGSQIKVDRWEKVSVGVSVAPLPGDGVGGGLSLRF